MDFGNNRKYMNIRVRELGLAAYVKLHDNAKLIKYEKNEFIFETEISENDWRIKYLESESYKHDTNVMSLRNFLRK